MDMHAVAGVVGPVKSNGKVSVTNHATRIAVPAATTPYRSFTGSRNSGFHSAPNPGDSAAIIYGPNNRVLCIIPFLDANTSTSGMPTLNPGESGQYHKDGRIADMLPNSGGATLYVDPTNGLSFTATTTRFVMNLILSVVNLIVSGTLTVTGLLSAVNMAISGTLTVTGLSTLSGGATLGGTLALGTNNITGTGSIGAGSITVTGTVQGSAITGTATVTAPTVGGNAYSQGGVGGEMVVNGTPSVTTTPAGGSTLTLPAHPKGYWPVNLNGVSVKVPVY